MVEVRWAHWWWTCLVFLFLFFLSDVDTGSNKTTIHAKSMHTPTFSKKTNVCMGKDLLLWSIGTRSNSEKWFVGQIVHYISSPLLLSLSLYGKWNFNTIEKKKKNSPLVCCTQWYLINKYIFEQITKQSKVNI